MTQPGTLEFDQEIAEAQARVQALLERHPGSEALLDALNELQLLQIVDWGIDTDSLTAAGNEGWRDQLRIPKGNGDRSGRWTFTPWKHLDDLAGLLNALGPDQALEARAQVMRALNALKPFDPNNFDVNDPKLQAATKNVAGLLASVKPTGDPSLDDALAQAQTGVQEFADTDWTLFGEATDIGADDALKVGDVTASQDGEPLASIVAVVDGIPFEKHRDDEWDVSPELQQSTADAINPILQALPGLATPKVSQTNSMDVMGVGVTSGFQLGRMMDDDVSAEQQSREWAGGMAIVQPGADGRRRAVVTHEIGHYINHVLDRNPEAKAEYEAVINEQVTPRDLGYTVSVTPGDLDRLTERWKLDCLRTPNGDPQSAYAQENRREWFGEAFADAFLNGDQAGEGSQALMAVIEKYLGGKRNEPSTGPAVSDVATPEGQAGEAEVAPPTGGRVTNKGIWDGPLPTDEPVNPDLADKSSQELVDELLRIKAHPVAPSPTARRKRSAYLKELNDRRDRDEQATTPEPAITLAPLDRLAKILEEMKGREDSPSKQREKRLELQRAAQAVVDAGGSGPTFDRLAKALAEMEGREDSPSKQREKRLELERAALALVEPTPDLTNQVAQVVKDVQVAVDQHGTPLLSTSQELYDKAIQDINGALTQIPGDAEWSSMLSDAADSMHAAGEAIGLDDSAALGDKVTAAADALRAIATPGMMITPEPTKPYQDTMMSVADLDAMDKPATIPDPDRVQALVEEIRKNGFPAPVLVEDTNMGPLLTDGIGRIAAAKILGIDQIPVRHFENTPEGRSAANRALVDLDAGRPLEGYTRQPLPATDLNGATPPTSISSDGWFVYDPPISAKGEPPLQVGDVVHKGSARTPWYVTGATYDAPYPGWNYGLSLSPTSGRRGNAAYTEGRLLIASRQPPLPESFDPDVEPEPEPPLPDTPVPASVEPILDKWVTLRGSGLLTKEERQALRLAVLQHGEKTPVLYRGVNIDVSPGFFKPGQALDFGPSSSSEDWGSAEPYASNGDHQPIMFRFNAGARGLNVQDRAERVGKYGEQEWITQGRFYVSGPQSEDEEGNVVVPLSTILPMSDEAQKVSEKPALNMDSLGGAPPPAPEPLPPVPITKDRLSNPDTPRTRPVTLEEYESLYAQGEAQFTVLMEARAPATGLQGTSWEQIKRQAAEAVASEWGGLTVDSHTGIAIGPDDPRYGIEYAITAKSPGVQTVTLPIGASSQDVYRAMEEARDAFAEVLEYDQFHLGVFRNEDTGLIEIDPVIVVDSLEEVDTIGLYTNAVGGAYHFSDGLGYWPPYLADNEVDKYVLRYGLPDEITNPDLVKAQRLDRLDHKALQDDLRKVPIDAEDPRSGRKKAQQSIAHLRGHIAAEVLNGTLLDSEPLATQGDRYLSDMFDALKDRNPDNYLMALGALRRLVDKRPDGDPWHDTVWTLADLAPAWHDTLFQPDKIDPRHLEWARTLLETTDPKVLADTLQNIWGLAISEDVGGIGPGGLATSYISRLNQDLVNGDPSAWVRDADKLRALLKDTPGKHWHTVYQPVFTAITDSWRDRIKASQDTTEITLLGKYGALDEADTTPQAVIESVGTFYYTRAKNSNCVLASQAYELRRRGLDVQPLAAIKGRNSGAAQRHWFYMPSEFSTYVDSSKLKGFQLKARYKAVVDHIEGEYGPSQRGTIRCGWKGRSHGHIWNWETGDDNRVTFYDAQTGEVIDGTRADYWVEMDWRYVEVVRLDDKPLRANIEVMLAEPSLVEQTAEATAVSRQLKVLAQAQAEAYKAYHEVEKSLWGAAVHDLEWSQRRELMFTLRDAWNAAAAAKNAFLRSDEMQRVKKIGDSYPVLDKDRYAL